MNKYDIAVVIGRFQPCHNVHLNLFRKALDLGDKVLILLGTDKSAPDVRNPFIAADRERMIRSCFTAEENERISFRALRDHIYNYPLWIAEVQNVVRTFQGDVLDEKGIEYNETDYHAKLLSIKVALVGHVKDKSSDYLKRFPQWSYEAFYDSAREYFELSATDIRNLWFEDGNNPVKQLAKALGERPNATVLEVKSAQNWRELVPNSVAKFMDEFAETENFKDLCREFAYIKQYVADSTFVGLPYAPIFVTTDAVVICNGHILLVRRGHNPGRGLLALPGGFLQPDLPLRDNAVKELREETKIRIDARQLTNAISASYTFDYPQRSLRGRTITHAFLFNLDIDGELPTISRKGGDDAVGAQWIPISSLPDFENQFFEDHYEIIKHFVRGEVVRGEQKP
jgi:bifunctional NMN adenylyltransferase/nudix hydrolase